MKAQLSLEVLVSMLLSLLIALLALQSLSVAHSLLTRTEYLLSRIANVVGAYPARLLQ